MPDGTILVVDDDPVIVKLLRVNFEMEGYAVISAEDGEAGLGRVRADRPDLVVLDVMMPGLNGLDVAGILKADPVTRDTPIILLSAKAQASDVAAGKAVADEYMTKPFDPLELLSVVAQLMPPGRSGP